MRTLLINPPIIANETSAGCVMAGIPLGIAMLGAALEEAGQEVKLLDAFNEGFVPDGKTEPGAELQSVSNGMCMKNRQGPPFPGGTFTLGLGFDKILDQLKETKPDIVGISVIFSIVYPVGRYIAKMIKDYDPSIKIVMGGNHSTAEPESVLSDDFVDYVIIGEGEVALVELVRCLEGGRFADICKIPGVGFMDRFAGLVINGPKLIEDLDSLPVPAFHKLPLEKYFSATAEGRTLKLLTSRGCTLNCCFCSVPYNTQRRFRARSPENVIAEIDKWVEEYGIKGVMFEDNSMTNDTKRAKEIFRLIAERDYGLKLYARSMRADLFDTEMLELLKKAGFETIWIAPLSGNQDVIDNLIDKEIDLDDVDRSVGLIRKAGLKVGVDIIIGIPGEKKEDIQHTVDYARRLKKMGVLKFRVSIATPVSGTRLYRNAVENGLIEKFNMDNFSFNEAGFSTEEFTAEDIARLRGELMAELNRYENAA